MSIGDQIINDVNSDLITAIRKGEYLLAINHASLDGMSSSELNEYLNDLRIKYQQKEQKPSSIAEIPQDDDVKNTETDKIHKEENIKNVETNKINKESEPEKTESPTGIESEDTAYKGIPSDVMLKAIRIGAEYDVSGEEICDRYLQVCRKESFDKEAVRDLDKNVLQTWDKGCEIAFIEPIKRGFLEEPPLFYLNRPSEGIAKQLDSVIPNWTKHREPALCYIYNEAVKEGEEEIYCPLGRWLGFYNKG